MRSLAFGRTITTCAQIRLQHVVRTMVRFSIWMRRGAWKHRVNLRRDLRGPARRVLSCLERKRGFDTAGKRSAMKDRCIANVLIFSVTSPHIVSTHHPRRRDDATLKCYEILRAQIHNASRTLSSLSYTCVSPNLSPATIPFSNARAASSRS